MTIPPVALARPLDTSERELAYVLPSGRGMVRVTPAALRLLRDVEDGRSWDEIAKGSNRSDGSPVAPEDVERAYATLAAKFADADRSELLRGGMWAKLPVLRPGRVAALARVGRWLYHPAAVAVGLVAIGLAATVALPAATHPSTAGFWPAFALFLVALGCHELGHASAAARYGAAPGEIGFVMYLVYPAFYSDVTSAWSLRRWQRVVVDVGGVYFELLFTAVLAAIYAVWPWEPLQTTFALVVGSVIATMNPILKFDGYWVLSDALGVPNLAQQPAVVARAAWARLRGREATLPWPWPVAAAVGVYAVVAPYLLLMFFVRLLPFALRTAATLPATALDVGRDLWALGWPDQLGHLVTSTYLLVFVGLALVRIGRSAVGFVARRIRR